MEVKMKKIVALLLAMLMVFGLAACGSNTTNNNTPAPSNNANGATNNTTAEITEWPVKKVKVLIPQATGAMLDLSGRIMVDYLNNVAFKDQGVVFEPENEASGGGARHFEELARAKGDGSVIMFHGAGAIVSYYSGLVPVNLADRTKVQAIAGNVGQEQPSGGVFLCLPDKPYNNFYPDFVDYVKAHPGEVRVGYVEGTPHEARLKLMFNYYGITDQVKWMSSNNTDLESWILGGNVELCCLTETKGAGFIKSGKLKGILNSVLDKHNYTEDLKPLDPVQIVTDIVKDPAEAEKLVCAWPMTIYGPASMSRELCEYLNKKIITIRDNEEYMARIKKLGSTNTYQIFTYDEINEVTQAADAQIKSIFETVKK
jgi:tripartite-type tricarboxylate transporter receptor subunit TctC